MPTPTAAERLHAQQQKNRKAAGLPDPSEYKKKLDTMKSEEVEQLDEMPESNMKTKDVHSHLKKSGWSLARSKGGHDVYKHPKAKHSIPVPRHNQLKAPLIRGILKASKVEEQLEKKGRFVSGPIKQPFKSNTIVTSVKEDLGDKITVIKKGTNIKQKISASSYDTFKHHGFRKEEALQEGRPSQRHPLEGHEYHKKSDEALVHIAKDAHAAAEAMKGHNTQAENKYRDQANDSATVRYYRKKHGMADWYKKKYGHVKEDTDPCWKGYKMVGMKNKNGRKVPNCVPGEGVPSMKKEDATNPTEGEMRGKQGYSRKAQIVMNAAKGKKSDNPDKFQKDPELSSEIHKT